MKGFPERVRKIREDRGMLQTDLAERTGLQGAAISHFECGRRKPSLKNLIALIEALDVSADWLLLGRGDP